MKTHKLGAISLSRKNTRTTTLIVILIANLPCFGFSNSTITSRCVSENGEAKPIASIVLYEKHIQFNCNDSTEIRSLVKNTRDSIKFSNNYCILPSPTVITMTNYSILRCDTNVISIRRNFGQALKVPIRQIEVINYDTTLATDSAYSSYLKRRKMTRNDGRLQNVVIALTMIGVVVLVYEAVVIIKALHDFDMPDP